MKRTRILTILSIILLGLTQITFAQTDVAQETKKTLKQYKKEKKIVDANGRSPESIIYKHIERASNGRTCVVAGETKCKSGNICRQAALNNAQNYLTTLLSTQIEGKIATIMENNASAPEEEIDKMVGTYVKKMAADISGCLEYSYSIYTENNDGTRNYTSYFFVDKSKISQNIERSLKETKMTIEEIQEITKAVENSLNVLEQ